jgi:hypothetical protein
MYVHAFFLHLGIHVPRSGFIPASILTGVQNVVPCSLQPQDHLYARKHRTHMLIEDETCDSMSKFTLRIGVKTVSSVAQPFPRQVHHRIPGRAFYLLGHSSHENRLLVSSDE